MPTDAGPTLPPDVQQAMRKPEQAFGRYILVRELGRGGMGAVYKAWQLDLRRYVAIKFLLGAQGEEELKRFYREAQTAAQVTHPNIAAIYEVGVQDGKHFIAMEFIDGQSMDKLAAPKDRTSLQRIAAIVRDAARAVDHAHTKGIIHRDLKPANIMVTPPGKVYVTDFGLAKQVKGDVKITGTGLIVGTPPFMSPEQAQGDAKRLDRSTDIWSLGATLYAGLTGHPPFEARGALATLHKVVNDDPRPPTRLNPSLSRELEAICLKALEKSKAKRYRTAGKLADDLDRHLKGEPVRAKPLTAAAQLWRWVRRRKAIVGGAAAIGVLALLLVWAILRPTPPPPLPPERKTLSAEDDQRLSVVQQFVTDLPARLSRERKTIYEVREEIGKARETLDEILRRNAEPARAHYWKARLLHLAGAHRKALQAYDECLRSEPNHVLALYHRARLRITTALTQSSEIRWRGTMAETLERAAADAEQAQRLSGGLLKDTDAKLIEAYKLYRAEKLEEALSLCRGNPAHEDFRFLAALILERFGRYEEAQAELDEAVRLRPWYYEALCEKATTLYYQLREGVGDEAKTLKASEEAIRSNPDFALSYYTRASVHCMRKRFDEMLKDATRALELDPDNPDIRLYHAVALAGVGKVEEGKKEFEGVLRSMPEEASAYFNLGILYQLAKRWDSAIDAFGKAIAKDPQFVDAYVRRASLFEERGDAIRAIEDARKASELDARSHRARWVAGRGYIELKKYPDAVKWLTEAIRLYGRRAAYYGDRGACYEALGDYPKAITDFQEAQKLDPKLEPQITPRIRKMEEALKKPPFPK